MDEDKIYSSFTGKYLKRGNEYYVASESAELFLNLLSQNLIHILGIEGFDITDKYIKPNLDIIADYSSNKDIKKSISASLNLVNKYKNKVTHFNFVLDL